MTTWWQRLQRVMTDKRISPETVSELSGVPLKSVYGYLKGDVANPRGDTLAKLAASVGVSEIYLRHGAQEPVLLKRVPLIDMNKIGTLNWGDDVLIAWDNVSTVPVPEDTPDDAFGITITDDANSPAFKPGDVVIFSASAPVEPGRYVLAIRRIDGAHFGRYKRVSGNRFEVLHDNPHWGSVPINGDQPGHLVARAIKRIQDI